jgi:hypothetical protein
MITVYISATGKFKNYVPSEVEKKIEDGLTLKEIKLLVGIPEEKNCGYMVNGYIKRDNEILKDLDNIKFIMLVGAG